MRSGVSPPRTAPIGSDSSGLNCVQTAIRSSRMNSLLLTGGRVIDPANSIDAVADLLAINGKIVALGQDATSLAPADIERMDVSGLVVCPGLIDLHVHLREPGQTPKE